MSDQKIRSRYEMMVYTDEHYTNHDRCRAGKRLQRCIRPKLCGHTIVRGVGRFGWLGLLGIVRMFAPAQMVELAGGETLTM